MPVVKVLIGEIDGQELDVPTEYELNLSGNFSYHRISQSIKIPSGQHMLACNLEITNTGSLEIEGDGALVVLL